MIIVLDDRHKRDLAFFQDQDAEILVQFCKITLDFVKKGGSRKIYATAARKLGVGADVVEGVINAIAYLLTEGARNNLTDSDFADSLVVLSFGEDLTDVLKQAYAASKDELRELLAEMSFSLPKYSDLDWRLDVQLASRSMRDQVKPVFIMRLDTTVGKELHSEYFQTDVTNLNHLRETLEAALEEIKQPYSRRVGRNI